jgi:hypothetical protein
MPGYVPALPCEFADINPPIKVMSDPPVIATPVVELLSTLGLTKNSPVTLPGAFAEMFNPTTQVENQQLLNINPLT